jgi:UDP-N-acetylglucosamine--N-acetylmuramyl-(pentapeptide) pyrophosphoryl-undecaprenol N-acetylglucosamine transferase
MRVYFGVCGLGLGHIGRCVPVAQRLREMGDEVLFSTYGDACSYVEQKRLPLCKAPPINYAVRQDGGIDFRLTTANPGIFSIFIFLNQLSAELGFMKEFNPDFVVSDSRISSILAARLLGIPLLTLLNNYRIRIPRERRFLRLARIADGGILTVVGMVWGMGEEIFIPDFPPPYTFSTYNLGVPHRRRSKIRLIGPILPVRPEDLPDRRVIRKGFGIDDEYLILAPISGPSREKKFFTDMIRRILRKLPENYRIIMSLGLPNSREEPVKEGNMLVYNWLPNLFEVLKACDVVISRAGLGTITQAICYGKPLVLIPTPSQTEQLSNAKSAEELGVAKTIEQRSLNISSLISALQETSMGSYRKRIHEVQKFTSKYDAIETMVKTIKKRQ